MGSNSIKHLLPAVLKSSEFIQSKYSKSIEKIRITSKNFSPNHVWLQYDNGKIINPYKLLPPLYENMTQDQINDTLSELDNIADGGAALIAYGKIQYTDMTKQERVEISKSLKRYCELDTLAMVMIFEHLKTLI
jgi:hypothetical protein